MTVVNFTIDLNEGSLPSREVVYKSLKADAFDDERRHFRTAIGTLYSEPLRSKVKKGEGRGGRGLGANTSLTINIVRYSRVSARELNELNCAREK